jgi:hypothetical protein
VITRLLVAAFLVGHAAIHAAYLVPQPPATAGGPAWPFQIGSSTLLRAVGGADVIHRPIALALIATISAAFAMAALAALAVVPALIWPAAVTTGAVASVALLVLFFHPWLLFGVAIDIVLLWLVILAHWVPEA